MSFGNRELKWAADLMLERMMAGVPEPEDCLYEETPEFRARIVPLFARARRMERMQKVRRAVASIVLALLTLAGTWLAVDTEVRAIFFQWVREVYEDSVIYRYFNDPELGELPMYTISPLPAGCTDVKEYGNAETRSLLFSGTNTSILLHYFWNDNSTALGLNSVDYVHERVIVQGQQGDFYQAIDSTHANELVWIDASSGITFKLSAHLDQTAIIELANLIQEHKS